MIQIRRGRTAGVIFAALWAFLAVSVSAYDGPKAKRIVDECRLSSTYCQAFVDASVEAHLVLNYYVETIAGHRMVCLPDDITYAVAVEKVLAYADARPGDIAVYSAGTFVTNAFERGFPCHQ